MAKEPFFERDHFGSSNRLARSVAPKDSVERTYGLEESQEQDAVANWLEKQSQLLTR